MVKFRKAGAKDFPRIKNLIKLYPQHLLQSPIPRSVDFFVAIADKRVVGCCALEVYSKRLAELRSLVVKEEFQGKGIATKLIKLCLARAKREKVQEVLTITSAVRLFGKSGFKTFRREKYALLKTIKQ